MMMMMTYSKKLFYQIFLTEVIKIKKLLLYCNQGGEGRVSKAENLRSSRANQSIFNLLGRTGKIIIF